MSESKTLFGDYHEMGHVWARIYKQLTRFSYLLTNWLMYLCGRIQSPRPDVMPDRREGIMRAAGFGFTRIDT